jgi:hypothetical protein
MDFRHEILNVFPNITMRLPCYFLFVTKITSEIHGITFCPLTIIQYVVSEMFLYIWEIPVPNLDPQNFDVIDFLSPSFKANIVNAPPNRLQSLLCQLIVHKHPVVYYMTLHDHVVPIASLSNWRINQRGIKGQGLETWVTFAVKWLLFAVVRCKEKRGAIK